MPEIALNDEHVAVVDEVDFEYLSQFNWFRSSHDYPVRDIWENGRNRRVYMHRVIANPKEDESVDHVNMDKLDNRRANLRICTHQQNQQNKKVYRNNKTGFKGVIPRGNRFMARISNFGKSTHLGTFDTPQQANAAYAEAAAKFFGPFARN